MANQIDSTIGTLSQNRQKHLLDGCYRLKIPISPKNAPPIRFNEPRSTISSQTTIRIVSAAGGHPNLFFQIFPFKRRS